MTTSHGDYIYKTTLRRLYGLSDAWIRRLGAPDKTCPNPHYKTGPAAQLYSRARVEAFIEANQAEYEKFLQGRQIRSDRMKVIAWAMAKELMEWAEKVEIEIKPLPLLADLEAAAEQDFYLYNWGNGRDLDWYPSPGAIVAYVRHNLSNYHELLASLDGKPGGREAYAVLRNRVNQVIYERFGYEEKLGLE